MIRWTVLCYTDTPCSFHTDHENSIPYHINEIIKYCEVIFLSYRLAELVTDDG